LQKRIVSGIMLTLLLIGMLTLAFQIQPVKAGTITVPDDYPTIQQAINNASEGDTIYVHSGHYAEDVVVDKPVSLIGVYFPALRSFKVVTNNAYIDGFCLQNPGVFPYGRAIVLDGVKGCIVSGVIVNGVDEGSGIVLEDASNNIIANCTVWGLPWGGCIQLVGSSNNTIFSNTIDASYGPCIYLENSSDNDIFRNNFYVYYAQQVEIRGISINVWDNGYPSGGNYWSDYNGTDSYFGPYQNVTGSDGIGDTPYVIDADNQDRYPLMHPWMKISGRLAILEPPNGSRITGPVNITFTIENTGEDIEFLRGDPSNRIDLEIEYKSTGGEIYAWGIMFWSTSHYGLTLRSGEKYLQTLLYDPSEYEGSVPPDFVGEAPYGEATIRLVHWKSLEPGYFSIGEFGVNEVKVTLQAYALTITATAGGRTDPAPGTCTYTANSTVQVTAIPEANYLFDYWELDSVNVGSANPYSVYMDKNHTLKAVFSPVPPPLSISISPLSASINVGQSLTFTSTVTGGTAPYSYQWYLNGNPVLGATSSSWTFSPATGGIYYVYLKVIDAKGKTTQSETARIIIATVPVGGYSFSMEGYTATKPLIPYLALVAILTVAFTAIKHKTQRRTKHS
jgi:parallel beta-helix repeat protein